MIRASITSERTGCGISRQISDLTLPGCSAFEVTPSGRRRASALLNMRLPIFDCAYAEKVK
ncbi:Uncharacterised protein [Mycobacteroides abscessus subsp. abscessus]|nr:Uncharacterised protein [Mycobacteroides abscessus subsp. abscessus]